MNPSILLHPNIPKPLHGINPRTILGWRWWDKVRYQAYKKHGCCCHACGIPIYKAKYRNLLEAHECYKINYAKGRMIYLETVALCHSCHCYIHSGKLEMDLMNNEISLDKYNDILNHGRRLLDTIRCSNPYVVDDLSKTAKWKDWRLILNNKEYKGKFENINEWVKFYSKI